MRPIVQTQTGAGNIVMPIDYMARPQVSLQVDVTGTVNWSVQQTLDNVFDVAPGAVTWIDHPDPNMVGQTVDRQSNYGYTPFAVRLVVNSGAGSAKITIIQNGTMAG